MMHTKTTVRIEDMNGSWVQTLRAQALEQRDSLQVPTYKNDNYRFTPLKDMQWNRPAKELPTISAVAPVPTVLTEVADGETGVVAITSGDPQGSVRHLDSAAMQSLLAQGVVFSDILSLLKDPSSQVVALLKTHLGLPAIFNDDIFANQCAAQWQNGIVVYVPKNIKVEGALRGVHWFHEATKSFFHRTLILVDAGSELQYVDEFHSDQSAAPAGDFPAAVGLVEVVAAAGAKVTYSQVQNWGSQCHFILRQSLQASKDATIRYVPLFAGGRKGQVRCEGACNGSGASIQTWGAVRGHGEEHFDFWSTTTHSVANTTSALDYWAVLGESAKAVFNGKIVITPEGTKTEAYQKNRNMLLSPKAEIHTIPKLEIATDDVKCAHGASVASVQEDQLYYLQTRGIGRQEAQEMIIRGFTNPVVSELPSESLRTRVATFFDRKSEINL